MNSGGLGILCQPGGSLYNTEHSNGGLITVPGGLPIKDGDGKTIGATGVSVAQLKMTSNGEGRRRCCETRKHQKRKRN